MVYFSTCGSCYTFGSTGALEAQIFKRLGKNFILSKQQIVDCDRVDHGCDGGLEGNVFRYIQANGIAKASDYRYTGRVGTCKYSASMAAVKVTKAYNEQNVSKDYLKILLSTRGPVAVAIYASDDLLQDYKTGIYSCSWCPTGLRSLDHSVLLVGYGSENGRDYWIIKNRFSRNF